MTGRLWFFKSYKMENIIWYSSISIEIKKMICIIFFQNISLSHFYLGPDPLLFQVCSPFDKYYSYSQISFKVFMNILFLYWIYIKSMNISHYGYVCPANFSKEKYRRVKEKKFSRHFFWKKQWSGIPELFANTSHLTNIFPIPTPKFWNSQTIPIPICTEVASANLFLFLFAAKITICWSLELSFLIGWNVEI